MKAKLILAALAASLMFAAEAAAKTYKLVIHADPNATMTVKAGSKTLKSGAMVAAKTKITVTVKPKAGYVLRGTEISEENTGRSTMSTKAKFTFKMPADMTHVRNEVVTKADEQSALDYYFIKNDLPIHSPQRLTTETIGGRTWYVGRVGGYISMTFLNSSMNELETEPTFSATGLPSGLKFVKKDNFWHLEGVPTGKLSSDAPAFVTVKGAGGSKCSFMLPLRIKSFDELEEGERRIEYFATVGDTVSIASEVGDWLYFYPSKTLKGLKWISVDGTGTFKPTAPGLYNIVLTRPMTGIAGTYNERRWVKVHVAAAGSSYFPTVPKNFNSTVGLSEVWTVSDWFSGGTKPTLTGLPPGFKFNAKKKSFSGTPTKAGTYVATVGKTVKGKVRKVQVVFEVAANPFVAMFNHVPANGSSRDTNNGVEYTPAGVKSPIMVVDVPSNAKVSASGLPGGVKLVFNKKTGMVSFSGRAKPGSYVTTVKVVADGYTQVFRYKHVVVASALRGSYRGYTATPGIGEGTITMSVDSMNKATLAITEGSMKTTVSAYPQSGYPVWSGDVNGAADGSACYTITLPANKKLKLGKRTVQFCLSVNADGQRKCEIGINSDSKGKGASYSDIACDPVENVDSLYGNYGYMLPHSDYRWVVHTTVDGSYAGSSCYASAALNSAGTATLTVRLPRGKAQTLKNVPIVVPDRNLEYIRLAPQVLTDSDGTRYLLVLPIENDYSQFNGSGNGRIVRVKKGVVYDNWGAADYLTESGTPESAVTDTVHYTPDLQLHFGASAPEVSYTMSFETSLTRPKIYGTTVKSYSYSSKTGVVTFSFVKGGYAYTVYMLRMRTDHKYYQGIFKRVKGKKTTWGTAVLVEGPAG